MIKRSCRRQSETREALDAQTVSACDKMYFRKNSISPSESKRTQENRYVVRGSRCETNNGIRSVESFAGFFFDARWFRLSSSMTKNKSPSPHLELNTLLYYRRGINFLSVIHAMVIARVRKL
jgi:hypothetical protein